MGSLSTKCCVSNCMQHVECPRFCRCSVRCKICCECCQCANCCEGEEDEEDLVQYISAFDVRKMTDKQASNGQNQTHVKDNGDQYIGELQAGKRHGFGEFIKSDELRYKGYLFENELLGVNACSHSDALASDADQSDFDSARLVIRKATLDISEDNNHANR